MTSVGFPWTSRLVSSMAATSTTGTQICLVALENQIPERTTTTLPSSHFASFTITPPRIAGDMKYAFSRYALHAVRIIFFNTRRTFSWDRILYFASTSVFAVMIRIFLRSATSVTVLNRTSLFTGAGNTIRSSATPSFVTIHWLLYSIFAGTSFMRDHYPVIVYTLETVYQNTAP